MRRLLTLAILAGALAAGLPGPAAGSGVTLTPLGDQTFPSRAWVLTLPRQVDLDPSQITITENGRPVVGASIVPSSQAGEGEFGVVIVLDTSRSMHGAAIQGAIEAARQFAAHRNPSEELAVVTFDGATRVALPFTTDPGAIAQALAEPPELASGTHIFDGVQTALELIDGEDIASGSIVVLSDGADTGSIAALAAVRRQAEEQNVRIFSVGLRSRAFDSSTLRSVAGDNGSYAEATSLDALTNIYDQLGAQLANQYLVRYRSLAGPSESVDVKVEVTGFPAAGTGRYDTPALPVNAAPPYHPSATATFWRSGTAVVLASLLCALLVGAGFAALLRPRAPDIRTRLAEFVSMPDSAQQERRASALTDKVLAGTERSLERTQWWERFKEELEIAEIRLSAPQILVLTACGTFVLMWLAYALGGLLFAPLALALPLVVRAFLKRKLHRRRALFAEQLPDNMQVLASALRAGHSFIGALSVVVDDSAEPSKKELQRAIGDEQLGTSLREALERVAYRMDNRDLEQVAIVASLQRETGGNIAEVLDRVTETVRERFELRRLVQTLTAQGRMSRWVVSLLPVVLLLAITAINPGYVDPLFHKSAGRALLLLAALLVVSGSLVIKRIVNIKV
ncbi:MAG TPA: type II secretion system F family protein [Gaiellaceae bacterium]|nr:type II secretion system F family protein [Gaiellaceae bacterium]